MRIVRTLLRVIAGFLLACITAALVLALYIDTPVQIARLGPGEMLTGLGGGIEHVLLVATHFALFSAAFTLIVAGVAEWLSMRTISYSLGAGMGIAVLGFIAQYWSEFSDQPTILNNYALQTFLTAGFFAGLVYWLIAGRFAGLQAVAVGAGPAAIEAEKKPKISVEKTSGEVKKGSLAERLANKRATAADVDKAASGVTAVSVTKVTTAETPAQPAKPAGPGPKIEVQAPAAGKAADQGKGVNVPPAPNLPASADKPETKKP